MSIAAQPPAAVARPWAGAACMLAGLASLVWAAIGLWPQLAMPAWPSISLGLIAIGLAPLPGGALSRGLGAFSGFVALLVGGAQIALVWVLAGMG